MGFCPQKLGGFITSLCFIEFSRAKELEDCRGVQSGSGNRRIVKKDLGPIFLGSKSFKEEGDFVQDLAYLIHLESREEECII